MFQKEIKYMFSEAIHFLNFKGIHTTALSTVLLPVKCSSRGKKDTVGDNEPELDPALTSSGPDTDISCMSGILLQTFIME